MKRLAVIGHPIEHSRSPAMHTAALAEMGLADEWSYEAIELKDDDFLAWVQAMPAEGFLGANVTIPYKQKALKVADAAGEAADEIGAANTLSFVAGEIRADNTDAQGLLDALPEPPEGKQALVLGAGGAARAVVWALVREGAEVDVWNRTPQIARTLCAELGGNPIETFDPRSYELLVNSTSVGLHGEPPFVELPFEASHLEEGHTIVDFVYGAERSQLLSAASAAGAATVDGIEILVQQGARSLEIWTGLEPPLDTMRAAARK